MKFLLPILAVCAMSALGAAPVAAQTYNAHLDTVWHYQTSTCSGAPDWHCYNGENGLTYFAPDLGGSSGNNDDEAFAAVVQPDGNIIIGGATHSSTHTMCELQRFLPNGIADTSFGTSGSGMRLINFGDTTDCALHTVAVGADGSVFAGGQIHDLSAGTYQGFVYYLPGGAGSTWQESFIGDSVNKVITYGKHVLIIGSMVPAGWGDDDFFVEDDSFDSTGLAFNQFISAAFDLGGGNNDRPSDAVLQPFITPVIEATASHSLLAVHNNQELYVVGTAQANPWSANHPNSHCAVAAFRITDGGGWALDSDFDGDGRLYFDLPITYGNNASTDTETLCYAAVAQPQALIGPQLPGILVGGERYYNHNLSGAAAQSNYDASGFALATVSPLGAVTPEFSDSYL